MISVVVVYDDQTQFETMLRWSLERQSARHELIALDNHAGRFRSAAQALNEGARGARGDFILFAHQDVRFDAPSWLDDAERCLTGLADLGVAGVAGARASGDPEGREVITNVEYDDPPRAAGRRLQRPEEVETVDECAFFVPRTVFERFSLDERTCDGWHLYAVDYCLTVAAAGWRVWALPLPMYHRSPGAVFRVMGFATFEAAYFRALTRVAQKHRERRHLHTTCGRWSTREGMLRQRFPPAAVMAALRVWVRRTLLGRP